jgi:putative endonuclease
VGVTNDLIRRIFEHREGLAHGFTKRYSVKLLVYFEQRDTPIAAIQREKNIKHWPREWKIDLIRSANPEWRDLYDDVIWIVRGIVGSRNSAHPFARKMDHQNSGVPEFWHSGWTQIGNIRFAAVKPAGDAGNEVAIALSICATSARFVAWKTRPTAIAPGVGPTRRSANPKRSEASHP